MFVYWDIGGMIVTSLVTRITIIVNITCSFQPPDGAAWSGQMVRTPLYSSVLLCTPLYSSVLHAVG